MRELRFPVAVAAAWSGSRGVLARAAVMASRAMMPWAAAESR
jgi:hypothetical protein